MEYDLPTFIDFVLKHTGKKNTVYIGHSQGTTQMFAKLASNPDFIDNISVFIALAPVASAKNLNVPLIGLLTNPVFVKGL